MSNDNTALTATRQQFDLSPQTFDQALTFSIKNLSLTRIEKHGADWRVAAVNEEPWTPPALGD